MFADNLAENSYKWQHFGPWAIASGFGTQLDMKHL
jgi:hypothetical protein